MPTPYYEDEWVMLYHGDCREILSALDPVDLLLTDPPYAVSTAIPWVRPGSMGTRRFDFFDGDREWETMTAYVLERVANAADLARAAYIWCGHRQFGRIQDMFEAAGWTTKFLVWRKKCPIPAPPGTGYDSAAELCVYAFRDGRKWNRGNGLNPNVIEADSYRHGQPGKLAHPTQKPPATAQIPILNSTAPGDTVLDPFAGSGTTLAIAKLHSRRSIGIEIEERYCEITARRLSQDVLDFGEVTV
jgi:site-specific DNA-methyltransferase (adenine-specific)